MSLQMEEIDGFLDHYLSMKSAFPSVAVAENVDCRVLSPMPAVITIATSPSKSPICDEQSNGPSDYTNTSFHTALSTCGRDIGVQYSPVSSPVGLHKCTQYSPPPLFHNINDLSPSPPLSSRSFLPRPEQHLFGTSILDTQNAQLRNTSHILHYIDKFRHYYTYELPSSSTVDNTLKTSNKVAAIGQVFNEVQMRIAQPIHIVEIVICGPMGVSYIFESVKEHTSGYIRNKFTTIISVCKVLKYHWIPNGKISAIEKGILPISITDVDSAIDYYRWRSNLYNAVHQNNVMSKKVTYDQNTTLIDDPLSHATNSTEYHYLSVTAPAMSVSDFTINFALIRDRFLTILFCQSPIRVTPFIKMTLFDALATSPDNYGCLEIIIRATDKVSNAKGLPKCAVMQPLLPVFAFYRSLLQYYASSLSYDSNTVPFFPKNLKLDRFCPSALRKRLDNCLSSLFNMPVTNNFYRHSVATYLIRSGVPRDQSEQFLRTSSNMLQKVYEQTYGTNASLSLHRAINHHLTLHNALPCSSSTPIIEEIDKTPIIEEIDN